MAKKPPFKFVYKKMKKCPCCGQDKLMFRVQKLCDECRRGRGLDGSTIQRRVEYDK